MSFAMHRITIAWRDYRADPCAKTMLALTRLLAQHQYDPKWPCHAWLQGGAWCTGPWQTRWHSALLSSLRTSSFSCQDNKSPFFRLLMVAKWPEEKRALKNIVSTDAWCPQEWWTLGTWLDQKMEKTDTIPELVAMWDPIWALAAPLYTSLGWRDGLQALYNDIHSQAENSVEKIDGSTCWSLD